MAHDSAQTLNLISLESGDRLDALVRALGQLDYRVTVSPPDEILAEAGGRPGLVYLGAKGWTAEPLAQLKACAAEPTQLLALDRTAFRWAEPAIRKARDFVTWPCPRSELKLRLERSCATRSGVLPLTEQRRLDRSAPVSALGLIGQSRVFVDKLLTLRRYAECDAFVLLHGETGTGKELAARAIHKLSHRSKGPFVPVCCGALPDSLIEAELFGHARGAFTDAREARPGLVAQAETGTLFLDEVDALSPKAQSALLRFLESLEYRRVGGSRNRKARLRVIAAGNADLHALSRQGAFRPDLLYRLNVLSLSLPALRDRSGDAVLLAEHFMTQYAERYGTGPLSFDPSSRQWLAAYEWPGNVRELENLVHRAVVTSTGPSLSLRPDTQSQGGTGCTLAHDFGAAKRAAVETFERDFLTRLMQEAGGNVTRAAVRVGKERRALGKLLKKHGLDPSAFQTD
ncbi:sigma 54-interacting transcriptional regulator [Yoonia sediminilitoris]|uniref:Nif-specific regulatory protein n=1 Tax=Yoonia sediminilitoris TaxID=1286148 RepID=A0A2T6KC60_9RHOB|nr:sigma-54 dependent transcriptional regulator [Yoonia sediminilitoris]PUB12426.1 DNA-binding NtrC family response regulator [Yoonia sediminilitoris]RCW93120.1 DNA-binding NtrC family response regulator [Yoonia sediminilitoris]